jgi:hypothetical protein
MNEGVKWALYQSSANRGARLVLTALADNANERGMVTLPVNKLATMTNLSRQAIGAAISKLVAGGDLFEMSRQGKSVTYRLACYSEAGEFIGAGAGRKEAA